MVSGLIAYFLGVPKHRYEIMKLRDSLPPDPFAAPFVNGVDGAYTNWANAILLYVQQMSYVRSTGNVQAIYNGEIPLDRAGNAFCLSWAKGKRQTEGSCTPPGSCHPI